MIVAALALAAFSTTPAAAAAGGPETVTDDYESVNWSCGYPMQIEGTSTSTFRERSDPHGGDRTLSYERFEYHETWTNEDGEKFSISGRALQKDLKVTPLGGSLYQVTAQLSGQRGVVMAGDEVLARDRGLVRFTFTHDIETGAREFLGVRFNGPHPGFETDLCKIVAPVVGTASAEFHTPRPLGTTEASMGYYEYLPPSYGEVGGGSPLLVVANGYGENGDGSAEGLDRLLFTGIPRFIDVGGWPLDRPLVVLSTQHIEQPPGLGPVCEDVPWFGSCVMQLQHDLGHPPVSPCTTPDELRDFIEFATGRYDVDPDRVYLTGLSCGAFGTWEYLAEFGDDQVAAAVPIAGEGRPAWATSACALGDVAIWAIHGELDPDVNPAGSIEPITSLSGCAGVAPERAKLSIYPGLGHDGWDQAYSGSEGDDIYSWMLGFTRD
ncbi:hypothetical protein GCM10010932_29760 [Agromyces flavus]|nr:hypothetical protein GCM10010932_29760 [Agromyces flavus]